MTSRELTVAVALAIVAACAGAPATLEPSVPSGAPDPPTWVKEGSVATPNGLRGVANVTGMTSRKLATETAQNKARTEVSRMISGWISGAVPTVDVSITADGYEEYRANEKQSLDTLDRVRDETGSRIEIREVWIDPAANVVWASAELPWTALDELIETHGRADPLKYLERLEREVGEIRRSPPGGGK